MMNKSNIIRNISLSLAAAGFLLICGNASVTNAQRDPFSKPSYQRPKTTAPTGKGGKGMSGLPAMPVNYGPPAIEARIEYYKHLRETAAASGAALPKVTSVLTLSEMAVTGIFKTPRGYAAMVEATPIHLSYTIYPGEKFFDGQLVAVEENRLVFRKVTKVGAGKFVASVENKPLRQFTMRAQIEGTAPSQPADKPVQTASTGQPAAPAGKPGKPAENPFLSPLDEMNKQNQPGSGADKSKGAPKKPVKVAKNSGKE